MKQSKAAHCSMCFAMLENGIHTIPDCTATGNSCQHFKTACELKKQLGKKVYKRHMLMQTDPVQHTSTADLPIATSLLQIVPSTGSEKENRMVQPGRTCWTGIWRRASFASA